MNRTANAANAISVTFEFPILEIVTLTEKNSNASNPAANSKYITIMPILINISI